ncbi:MAG: UPF0280 family protein [Pseudomonadota bacterium]
MTGAQITRLPDGRLHLHEGPIDLICQAYGTGSEAAHARAVARFDGLLRELVAELPSLRGVDQPTHGPIARVMAAAVAPFRPVFITPMAAVAGAVAEAVLAAMVGPGVERAYVNNGGDIALHLGPGQTLTCALAGALGSGGTVVLRDTDGVRGIATSGWGGRSWSLGIADAVTVLARSAAMADAAATMIANAVDLPGHAAITRRPAVDLQADSDLGQRLVTVGVGPLTPADRSRALDAGLASAQAFRARGLIDSAALFLHSDLRVLGPLFLPHPDCTEPAYA